MINNKKKLFQSIFYFYNLLKKKKLNSSEKEFFLLNKFVKKSESVIDVGSNIGRYTFKLSQLVGRNGFVYSFEPVLRNYLILISLIFLRNIRNIIPLNLALSNKSSFLSVKPLPTNDKINSFKFNTYTASKIKKNYKLNAYAIKLDEFKFKKKISFIKIDCEGSEYNILCGAKKLIKKYKPLLLIELIENNNKIENLLKKIGYKKLNLKLNSRNGLFAHSKYRNF